MFLGCCAINWTDNSLGLGTSPSIMFEEGRTRTRHQAKVFGWWLVVTEVQACRLPAGDGMRVNLDCGFVREHNLDLWLD